MLPNSSKSIISTDVFAHLSLETTREMEHWAYHPDFSLCFRPGILRFRSKVNREMFKSEQTAFLAVGYRVGEEAKGLACGSKLPLQP